MKVKNTVGERANSCQTARRFVVCPKFPPNELGGWKSAMSSQEDAGEYEGSFSSASADMVPFQPPVSTGGSVACQSARRFV